MIARRAPAGNMLRELSSRARLVDVRERSSRDIFPARELCSRAGEQRHVPQLRSRLGGRHAVRAAARFARRRLAPNALRAFGARAARPGSFSYNIKRKDFLDRPLKSITLLLYNRIYSLYIN